MPSLRKAGFSDFMYKHNNIEILEDTTTNGRKRDWKGKKKRSDLMAAHYESLELLKKANFPEGRQADFGSGVQAAQQSCRYG